MSVACACTVPQARKAHSVGEITLASALVGMLATFVAAELVPSHGSDIMRDGIVFVPIAVAGALVYVATDGLVNDADTAPVVTARDRARGTAWDLARQAKHAARVNDCAEVQAIEPRVRELDAEIYRRFLHDEIIRRCLSPAPEP